MKTVIFITIWLLTLTVSISFTAMMNKLYPDLWFLSFFTGAWFGMIASLVVMFISEKS